MIEVTYLDNDIKTIQEVRKLFEEELATIQYYSQLAIENELKHYTVGNISEKVQRDDKSVIIALEHQKVIGVCFSRFDDYTIWGEWVIISKTHTTKGVGTLLMDKLKESARLRKCHKIWGDCRSNNEISKSFLQKNGFEIITEIKNHWYGQDFVLVQKYV